MAVIQYSALLTQMRGKLGGSQFNKTFNGYTLQRKATQPRRNTAGQSIQRQRMQEVQRLWKTETSARQAEASQAAASNPTSDRFGQQVTLSGYQHYVKMMLWRLLSNRPFTSPIITTPVNAAAVVLSNVVITYLGMPAPGQFLINITANRAVTGSPTGSSLYTRGMLYLTLSDQYGKPLRGARRVYFYYAGYRDSPYDQTQSVYATSMSIGVGSFVLLEVLTVNTGAGAQTGYGAQVVQIQ